MSRSVRKTSKCGWCCCKSEKSEKTLWHQKMRALMRQRMHLCDPDNFLIPLDIEASDVWTMGKEGKTHFDPHEFPKLMRK